jgi:membrane-bound lytic murein transglycosylase A
MPDRTPISFDALSGWGKEDHEAAFAAFSHSAPFLLRRPPTARVGSATTDDLLRLADLALSMPSRPERDEAKAFFETNFEPQRLTGPDLLTGYYEPSFPGSRQKSARFSIPLHRRPPDLVAICEKEAKRAGFSTETSFARKSEGGLSFHVSRGEVMAGALDGAGLELCYLESWIDAYIIHIQGSARIALDDGTVMRVSFAGKSGQPYVSIGKKAIERGIFTPQSITMDKLMAYLAQLGDEALPLLAENPSYIFFDEAKHDEPPTLLAEAPGSTLPEAGPIAAASIPLIPMRSLAVDRSCHTFGLPLWLEAQVPFDGAEAQPFHRLVFAHDTGSAIKGLARGDLFVGTGGDAGALAGRINQQASFTQLMPKARSAGKGAGKAGAS